MTNCIDNWFFQDASKKSLLSSSIQGTMTIDRLFLNDSGEPCLDDFQSHSWSQDINLPHIVELLKP